MLFSVIVPIYNVEKYLSECIESVLNQSCKDFELILVDDESPDNSPIICDKYASLDSRINVIHKKNGGVVSARVDAACIASGKYILCLDGDDTLQLDALKSIENVIFNHHPDVVCFGCRRVYDEKIVYNPIQGFHFGFYDRFSLESEIYPNLLHKKNVSYFPPSVCLKAIKTDLFRESQSKVPENIHIGEDAACSYLAVYSAQSLFIMQDCLYNYRQHSLSITHLKKAYSWEECRELYLFYEKQLDLNKFDLKSQWNRALTHSLFNVALSQYNRIGKYRDISEDIRKKINEIPEYKNAIRCSDFSAISLKFVKFVLLHDMYVVLFLLNKIKQIRG